MRLNSFEILQKFPLEWSVKEVYFNTLFEGCNGKVIYYKMYH